jgi:hypothetical protein
MNHICHTRCCTTADGKLVSADSPLAAALFAGVDSSRSTPELARYTNAADFFTNFTVAAKPSLPVETARVIESPDEPEEPRKQRGRPPRIS